MSTGATDAIYFGVLKIPVYGVPGLWLDPDLNGIHGLDERIEIKSVMTGRDYLTDLVKMLGKREIAHRPGLHGRPVGRQRQVKNSDCRDRPESAETV